MLRISLLVLLSISVVGCSKKGGGSAAAGSGSGSGSAAMAGSGSAAAMAGSGSGSAEMAGSGSAMAGSGSGSAMAGSGSAMAGSGSGSGSAAAEGSGAGSGSAAANDFDFQKLDHKARVAFMKTKVMPAMKTAFQEFDAKKFAKFNCKTCHGKNAEKNKFKMPNGDIPKLDFVALKAGKQAPKMAEFMGKTVKPQMAQLLNMPEFTEEKPDPKAFGCLNCHEQKK